MRMPFPFSTRDLDLSSADVHTKVLVDMPVPQSLGVHLANEHGIDDKGRWFENQTLHMAAHTYAQFRAGSEHYHNRDEAA